MSDKNATPVDEALREFREFGGSLTLNDLLVDLLVSLVVETKELRAELAQANARIEKLEGVALGRALRGGL